MIEYVLEMDDVQRVHGRGETAVHALRGVSLGVPLDVARANGWDVELARAFVGFGAEATPDQVDSALAAAQALLVAGVGCALGVAFGTFVAYAARTTTGSPDFVVPWANLAITAVAVPLLAVLVAALFTPSRLPLVRRATWAGASLRRGGGRRR